MKNKFKISYIIPLFLICILQHVTAQNINHPDVQCPGGVMVNSFNGNMHLQRNDLFVDGRKFNLNMTFYYSSDDQKRNFGYGNGWGFQYLLQYIPDSSGITIHYANGFEVHYATDSINANLFHPEIGVFDSLSQYQPGKYVLITKHKIKYFFDSNQHKRLTRCEEPNGNFLNFVYTDSLITQVTDAAGRSMQLAYSGGKLSSITDALDAPTRIVQYTYDGYGNLTEVTDPAGNKRKYKYLINGPMNAVTDKNDNVVDVIYNADFSVQEVISCITDQRFSYNLSEKTSYLVEVNGSSNQVTAYKYDEDGNLKQKTGNCCGFNVSYQYDDAKNITRVTDANGNKTEFTYDGKGNILSKKDAAGNTSYYIYEPNFNRIASYTNKNGNTISYSHDNKGNRTQVSYPMGIIHSFTYAANGDLTGTVDGNGNTTTYTYNSNGDLTAVHQPLNVNHTLNCNNRGWVTSYTDPRNNTKTFAYDIMHRVTTTTDALNHPATFTYDANNNLLSYTDRKGHTASMGYDALNRMIIVTDPQNHASHFSYDAKNNLISTTDANGNTSKFSYDNLNRLVTKSNAANETIFYNYDDAGNVTTVSYPNGNDVNYTYDALNRRTGASDDIGMIFSKSFDNIGNMISMSDANGNTRTYSYDALNRRINSNDPLGHSTAYSYDNNFNLVSFSDRNSNSRAYTYDALNRVVNFTDALNHATTFAYDLASNLTSVTDANSHSTSYTYDALNRNTVQTFADNTTNIYAYDNNGTLINRTDNNGAVINYGYDDDDRLVTRDFPGSNDDAFTYDAGNRMLTATNSHAVVSFTYDVANRRTSETLNGKTTSYGYDIAGNKRIMAYPGGRSLVRTLDARGRLAEIREGNTVMSSYSYDAANRLIVKNYPANGTFTSYNYDAANRLTSMVTGPGNLLNFEYGYDNAGNKLFERKLHKPDHSEEYDYDDSYQLTDFKSGTLSGNSISSPLHQNEYNYDALGNRTSVTEDTATTNYSVNNMNAYTSITGANAATMQYDNNGNLINDGTYSYSYDSQNRLTAVNNGATASYQYDALGRRIRKTVDTDVTDFIYSGVHEIENRNDTGGVFASYVFGRGVDNIQSAKINGTDYFYYKNALGSVSAVAGSNGNIVERYEYDPFGGINFFDNNYTAASSSSINNGIYYTGRTFDNEIDKYYYRARHYDATNGRFMQHDPLKYIDGLNMYAYTGNNVSNKIDPFGTIEAVGAGLETAGAVYDWLLAGGGAVEGGGVAGSSAGEVVGFIVEDIIVETGTVAGAGATGAVAESGVVIGLGGGLAIGAVVVGAVVGLIAPFVDPITLNNLGDGDMYWSDSDLDDEPTQIVPGIANPSERVDPWPETWGDPGCGPTDPFNEFEWEFADLDPNANTGEGDWEEDTIDTTYDPNRGVDEQHRDNLREELEELYPDDPEHVESILRFQFPDLYR